MAMNRADEDQFHTTQWSEIDRAKTVHGSRRREAVNALIERYWRPVYVFLRTKGYRHDLALDVAQGFFTDVVLERNLFQQANQAKGRFRAYLLTALTRYTVEVYRKANAKSRRPTNAFLRIDAADVHDIAFKASPEHAFDYTWATSLIDRTLEALEAECRAGGMEVHWNVFFERVIQPTIQGSEAPSLESLCRRYQIASEKVASNVLVTAKRQFRRILNRHLQESVGSEGSVEEELRDLITVLSS